MNNQNKGEEYNHATPEERAEGIENAEFATVGEDAKIHECGLEESM